MCTDALQKFAASIIKVSLYLDDGDNGFLRNVDTYTYMYIQIIGCHTPEDVFHH